MFIAGVASGIFLSFFIQSEQRRAFSVCEFDDQTLNSRVSEGWDINSSAFSPSGKTYPYVLGQIFNPKCIKDSADEFDREMAYIYLSKGGLIDLDSLKKIYRISKERGDKPMMDLVLPQFQ